MSLHLAHGEMIQTMEQPLPRSLSHPNGRLELLVKVSRLYYEDGMKQPAIADLLHISQARVSRLLRQAMDQGIVRISVVPPVGLHPDMEDAIRDRYSLIDVVVVDAPGTGFDAVTPSVGTVAGQYIEATLNGGILGLSSWSSTLLRAVDAMRPSRSQSVKAVVQLIGGVGRANVQVEATRLAMRLSEVTRADTYLLPAPGIAASPVGRDALLSDPQVARTAELWSKLTIALVGIGSLDPSPLIQQSGNTINPAQMAEMRKLGAVGDVVLRFYNESGDLVESSLNDCVVGIDAETYRAIPRRVGVAGGQEKHQSIRAALLGGWVNILITDKATAQYLIDTPDPPAKGA